MDNTEFNGIGGLKEYDHRKRPLCKFQFSQLPHLTPALRPRILIDKKKQSFIKKRSRRTSEPRFDRQRTTETLSFLELTSKRRLSPEKTHFGQKGFAFHNPSGRFQDHSKVEKMGEENPCLKWVNLNVGGKKLSTTVDTLTRYEPNSMLSAMFSGRYNLKKEKGYIVIDRDGECFGYILKWLRHGLLPRLEHDKYLELLREADYFQLHDLKKAILDVLNSRKADLTRTEVIKGIQSGATEFRGIDLHGLDLSKLNLSNINFTEACLREVNFAGALLVKAKLDKADAEGALFCGSSLQKSSLTYANLCGASFVGANLQNSKLNRASLSRTDLTNANLQDAEFCEIDAVDCNFKGANCELSNFTWANICRCSFNGTNLYAAKLYRAQLTDCIFTRADMRLADLGYADLSNVDMHETDFEGALLRNAEMSQRNYEMARARGGRM